MSNQTSDNNKRLVKNTILLYARTVILLLMSLYLTRVVLQALGVEDFGIYNVVGGVVAIIATINQSMSGAASRFVSYALGQKEKKLIYESYSTIKIAHWILAAIILVIGETIGLWFVVYKLVIPEGREFAAMICYQCSLFTSIISIISVPYNATIIGHERMGAFAYMSILEASLKLAVAILLLLSDADKLILYAILICFSQLITQVCYVIYCNRNFEETKSKLVWNKKLFVEIASFAGWTFNGQLAVMGYTQGINILMNLFFGPVVNAARGISVQIQTAAKILVNNFQVAIRPQMIKTWAAGDIEEMHKIIVNSTKLSFFLTAFTAIPLLITISPILHLWLGSVPDHTIEFARIILFTMFVDAFAHGMIVSVHATGTIRKFQIYEGSFLLLVVPIAYILLKFCNITAEQVMLVYLFVQMFTQLVRMSIALPLVKMSIKSYCIKVFPRVFSVFLVLIIPVYVFQLPQNPSFLCLFLTLLCSVLFVVIVVYAVGLSSADRERINIICSQIIKKCYKR